MKRTMHLLQTYAVTQLIIILYSFSIFNIFLVYFLSNSAIVAAIFGFSSVNFTNNCSVNPLTTTIPNL